jgi:RNA polymerase sigma factor (sigma-70 family)
MGQDLNRGWPASPCPELTGRLTFVNKHKNSNLRDPARVAAHASGFGSSQALHLETTTISSQAALPGLADASLVSLARRGVEPAFALLCKRHSGRMRNLIAARLTDSGDVPDVVQETQLALWRALHRYDVERHFESWLTTIAINKCRDWARRRAVRRETLARLGDDVVHGVERSCVGPAESELMEEERLGALRKALTELPDSLRDALVRTALHQDSQAVVARQLNITVKAVEMRIRRARQRLHSVLAAT